MLGVDTWELKPPGDIALAIAQNVCDGYEVGTTAKWWGVSSG